MLVAIDSGTMGRLETAQAHILRVRTGNVNVAVEVMPGRLFLFFRKEAVYTVGETGKLYVSGLESTT